MREQGVIETDCCEWGSQIVFYAKSGTKLLSYQLHFCLYYGNLNAIKINEVYLKPRMDGCIYGLKEAQSFTSLYCNSG